MESFQKKDQKRSRPNTRSSAKKKNETEEDWQTILTILITANPGILMVDHIHFQYNALLYGFQLLSIACFFEKRFVLGSIWFAIVLNFKHIYLYQAPAYFVYLLASFCFKDSKFSFRNFLGLGLSVISVFAISFGPFYKHIPQILSRLFPFGRGLTHAYWAPNFWALYCFVDRVLNFASSFLFGSASAAGPSLTRGLVGDVTFVHLPNIQPLTTAILTFASQIPILLTVWRDPTPNTFVKALTISGFCSFMFGYHVHEKAIILVLIPLS